MKRFIENSACLVTEVAANVIRRSSCFGKSTYTDSTQPMSSAWVDILPIPIARPEGIETEVDTNVMAHIHNLQELSGCLRFEEGSQNEDIYKHLQAKLEELRLVVSSSPAVPTPSPEVPRVSPPAAHVRDAFPDELISTTEAARMIGCSSQNVRNKLETGELTGQRTKKNILIYRSSAEAFANR